MPFEDYEISKKRGINRNSGSIVPELLATRDERYCIGMLSVKNETARRSLSAEFPSSLRFVFHTYGPTTHTSLFDPIIFFPLYDFIARVLFLKYEYAARDREGREG